MLFPLRIPFMKKWIWGRRRVLSLGSPISCPTVTYMKNNLPVPLFLEGYRSNLDWQAWERYSKLKGEFIYCPKICMYHRIHKESATTEIIADQGRSKEDFEMFCKFWPVSIARVVAKLYRYSEKSNDLWMKDRVQNRFLDYKGGFTNEYSFCFTWKKFRRWY